MARVDVVMPQMGESIAEGTIVKWHKKVGDAVKKDETLLEISTDKVDSEIPSPATGILAEIAVAEQTTVPVLTIIAYIETNGTARAGESAGLPPAAPAAAAPPAAPHKEPRVQPASAPHAGPGKFYSPLVMNIARTEGVSMTELEAIAGSGENGRVTKTDLLGYLDRKKQGSEAAPQTPPEPVRGHGPAPAEQAAGLRAKYPAPEHEILQMSNVVQKMAEHMVQSIRTSPHVAAVHEVDMTEVSRHRETHGAAFEKRERFKLTYTPYIVEAVARAIKKYPLMNCSLEGDKIIKKNYINLGIAVASENGLIVPVVKHAEEKNFVGIARAINDLAVRTRAKKLSPEEVQGGTFTISNYGVFGTLIGTPIINQPQVAILGTGAIRKRPVVINDAIAIRAIAYFTLSFDHRVVDGALGGMFLEDIVRSLEQFDAKREI